MSLLPPTECTGSTALCNPLLVRFPRMALSWEPSAQIPRPSGRVHLMVQACLPQLLPVTILARHAPLSPIPPAFQTLITLFPSSKGRPAATPISQPGALGTLWLQDSSSPELMFSAQSVDSSVALHPLCRNFPQVTLHDPGVLLPEIFPQSSLVLCLGPAVPRLHSTIEFA